MFVINSRGGGRKVEDISDAPHEREVLFPPESRFKVLKIEELGIDTKVLQSEGEHAIRQRVVYLDEVPVPTKLTKVEKQGLGQKPSFLSQDAVLMPTRIRRAMGQGELDVSRARD